MENFSKGLVDALRSVVSDCKWQFVGKIDQFKPMKCQRLISQDIYLKKKTKKYKYRLILSGFRIYSLDVEEEDIIVIKDKNGKFYAMDSRCSHEG